MAEIQTFRDGRWEPSVPLPLYVRSWRTWFRWRYRCQCGEIWSTEIVYQIHWRAEHIERAVEALRMDDRLREIKAHDYSKGIPVEECIRIALWDRPWLIGEVERLRVTTAFSDSAFRCLSAALKAMNDAVEITTASGPAAGMEWIADYLNGTDSIDEDVADHTPDDWLTQWVVGRPAASGRDEARMSDDSDAELEAMAHDCARFIAALREIAAYGGGDGGDWVECCTIARQALEGQTSDDEQFFQDLRSVSVYCEPGKHRVPRENAHEIATGHGYGRAWRCSDCSAADEEDGA